MNKLNLLSFILLIFCLCSCRAYLTPAVLGHNLSYMPKPLVADSVHSKTYVNAAFGASSSPLSSVNFQMGIININRAHTYRTINFSYGLMGYLGNAKYIAPEAPLTTSSTTQHLPNFNKISSGLGIRTSVGFHIVSSKGNTDFRLLNWENSINTEMGSYASYRKELFNGTYTDTYVSRMQTLWTTGFSSEIAWHPRKNKNFTHAFRMFLGGTPNLHKSFKDISNPSFITYGEAIPTNRIGVAYSYFLQFKRIHFTYEVAANINLANNISLGYSF